MEVGRQIVWRINDLTRRAVSWPCNWPCEVLMGEGEWIVGGCTHGVTGLDMRPANARRPWILGLDWVPGEEPEEPVNWWRHSTVWPVKAPEQDRPSHHSGRARSFLNCYLTVRLTRMYLISLILSFLSPVSIGHSQSISTPWTQGPSQRIYSNI